jgi:YHS domain-containing protein
MRSALCFDIGWIMSRLILFIILFLLLYTILRYLIKDTAVWRKKLRRESEPEELVQDPYCQTYISKRLAIRKRLSGKDYYFCKQECLEKFIQNGNP